ncbi:apolipoprotein N-acyltransferase [Alkalilacustris brevis]|uniref:apolipoprotein N-acyltransferase n=1 Tax=Alkalilacustris brevis TaxID=2026338 RepID=UPI000E0CE97D|nr:apolipoprotein N-acyltransferase [Alkalilacustris brevis]
MRRAARWLRGLCAPPVRPGWRLLGGAALLGALVAAGQAPLGWWWLSLPALAALMALIATEARAGRAVWLGWFGGAAYFAAALFWIVEPFFVDPARHGWMAPFALIGMSFGLALFWALAAGAAFWLGGASLRARARGLVLTLAAAELLRGHVLTGFPWAMPGHIWLDTPLAQLAALIGASGLTALTFALAALPLLAGAGWLRRGAGGVAAFALLAGGWLWGEGRLAAPVAGEAPGITLRLVQPNAPQHLKWHPDWARHFFERQLDLTAAPPEAGAPAPDLVIWSETAIPWLLDEAGPALEWIAEAAGGGPVALGVQRREGARYFNSLALIEGDAGAVQAVYDKHHLVPFGEYVPLAEALLGAGYAGLASRQLAGYSKGPGPELMDFGAAGRVLPLICYEAVFPRHLRATERPDWVLQATNDAWFGRLSGPFQHLAQARFRAIEMGLPVVRAANTGVSGVIDARGRMLAGLGLGQAGVVDAPLPAADAPTVFARRGEAPLAALLVLLLGVAGLGRVVIARQR